MLDAAVGLIGRSGELSAVKVAGISMHPTFRDVEQLAVEFSPADLARGDVLVFRQRETLVVHRLVQCRAGRLRTRGDGTIAFDAWLDRADVIGRVRALGYPAGLWRGVRGRRAGLYARAVAAHALCWSGLGLVVWRLGGYDWQWRLGRLDRFTLGLFHALLFRALHPVVPAPAAGPPRSEARCYTPTSDRSEPGKKSNAP